jgi:hypothetical protein
VNITEDIDDFIGRLEKETFDLIKLYDHFVEKKLQVYYEEKCGMDLSKPQTSRTIKQMKQKILENYETLAVRQILKTDVEKYFPSIAARKLDEDELEDLVKVGLIYEANNQWKFAHQTYAEYGFKKFLDKNFDHENCAKFIVEVVLVDPSYQVIRTFMNFWILEKVNEETCAVYQKILLESSVEGDMTPLHLAGREGKENIFCFLYSTLATEAEYFKNNKKKIQDYLLKIEGDKYEFKIYPHTAFVEYFRHCEDHFNILSKVQSDFDVDFLKTILTSQMGDEQNFLHAICQNDSENVFKVFNFLRDSYLNDLKFLREVFLTTDKDGASFLHFAFMNLEIETLFRLFEELNSLKELFGQDFLNELFLMRSHYYGGVFLSSYAYSKQFSNDYFLSFFNQIKLLCDQETLKKFFFVVNNCSQTLLHKCCDWAKNFDLLQVLEWVARELGKKVLTDMILLKDYENHIFFHFFTSSHKQSNSGSKLLSILRFLKNDLKFENEFLIEKILFTNDENGENVFLNLFLHIYEKELYQNVLDFLANELDLKNESLKKYLIQNKFLLFRIAQIKKKQLRAQLLNFFQAKFGKSRGVAHRKWESFVIIWESYRILEFMRIFANLCESCEFFANHANLLRIFANLLRIFANLVRILCESLSK